MTQPTVLCVDDDKNLLKVVQYNLEEEGYKVLTAPSAEQALELIADNPVDLVLTDVRMPGMGGMELLENVRHKHPDLPVILITAFAAIDSAVEAIQAGAVDYIPKPFNQDDLKYKVKKALEHTRLKQENLRLKSELARRDGFEGMIGSSERMREVFEMIAQVADSDATVLITGESGTGKELAARAVHSLSSRAEGPWLPVNCAAIPRDLLESDLFGHVKGAFTGAVRDRAGKFELAHHGTIFLDEIADVDITLQPKLLRALQEREVQRIGDSRTIKVDVRIIAATRYDLMKRVEQGAFREDLYYRLNVIPLHMPLLIERKQDIPLLANHFLEKYATKDMSWSEPALKTLETYSWLGNVRELENMVERIAVLNRGKEFIIMPHDLPTEAAQQYQDSPPPRTLSQSLPDMEKQMVIDALKMTRNNKSQAARILGIPRHVLLYRIKKYNILT